MAYYDEKPTERRVLTHHKIIGTEAGGNPRHRPVGLSIHSLISL